MGEHRNQHSNLQARKATIIRDTYLIAFQEIERYTNLESYENAKICRNQELESENHTNKSIFTTRESSV